MQDWFYDIVYPINRWLHLVCTTLILGGTLFFELVLPASIEELKREQQLYVFARARLVFRWVVWIGVVGLLLSGALSLARQWDMYRSAEFVYVWRWALAHVLLGSLTLVIALLLTVGNRPPENPVLWMRLNVVILMIAIFLGSATRHFQLALREKEYRPDARRAPGAVPDAGDYFGNPATQPATAPSTLPATQDR